VDALDSADMLLLGAFRFNRRRRALFHLDSGAQIPIGSRALGILGVLIECAGELVAKDEIMDAVWPETVVEDANLTVHISTLRRILDAGRLDGSCIQTISGRGYRFVGSVTRPEVKPSIRREAIARPRARAAARLSIVVLPFANRSNDRAQEYFADAITEDLTTDLSRIAGSFVISCNTAFTYKGKWVSAKHIGRELCVRYVVEGSLQRSGNQVRVNAQLIDAETDTHVWAERFERDTGDLFVLQNEVTARIAYSLGVGLINAEAARPTASPDALDYILRARAAFARGPARATYPEAIGMYERALALDARSVEAQSGLAATLMSRVHEFMSESPAADIARADALIGQVLAASPSNQRAHFAKGQMRRAQGRWEEALAEYEMVVALDHNSATGLVNIGRCRIATGFLDDAIAPMERAIRLSPRDPFIGPWYSSIGQVHLLQSRIDEAILWYEKARSANPERAFVRIGLASAYGLKGECERAAGELADARRLSSDDRFSSIARYQAAGNFGVQKIRALFETTYFAGLRLAGMPEE